MFFRKASPQTEGRRYADPGIKFSPGIAPGLWTGFNFHICGIHPLGPGSLNLHHSKNKESLLTGCPPLARFWAASLYKNQSAETIRMTERTTCAWACPAEVGDAFKLDRIHAMKTNGDRAAQPLPGGAPGVAHHLSRPCPLALLGQYCIQCSAETHNRCRLLTAWPYHLSFTRLSSLPFHCLCLLQRAIQCCASRVFQSMIRTLAH